MPTKGVLPLSPHALPITVAEFENAFYSALQLAKRASGPTRQHRIGLAISGGVDSMALASLCMSLKPALKLRVDFTAFIVDHCIRRDSRNEARSVKSALERLGLPARILALRWPIPHDPASIPNFETLGRTLRYRALGKACFKADISSLLLAHHEDDQVETVLMRLASGYLGNGLKGIKERAEIPECRGIWGVGQSGGPYPPEEEDLLGEDEHCWKWQRKPESEKWRSISSGPEYQPLEGPKPMMLEAGGIQIYRPLLSFSKSRLEATCLSTSTRWFEDPTNANPTLTPRNAIRHLLASNRLPKSLQKESILRLNQEITRKFDHRSAVSERIFQKQVAIEKFDLRSGRMIVQLPRTVQLSTGPVIHNPQGKHIDTDKERTEAILSHLVRRLIEFVTPLEIVPLSKLTSAIRTLFPYLDPSPPKLPLASFTIAGVLFERLPSTSSTQQKQQNNKPTHTDPATTTRWHLHRQPHGLRHDPPPSLIIKRMKPRYQLRPRLHRSSTPPSSPFHLFDGRFWIRIRPLRPAIHRIRPLYPADLAPFRARLAASDPDDPTAALRRFDASLKDAAPGRVRYGVPVVERFVASRVAVPSPPAVRLAEVKQRLRRRWMGTAGWRTRVTKETKRHAWDWGADVYGRVLGRWEVVAFPSLGFGLSEEYSLKEGGKKRVPLLGWECRYKKVDWGMRRKSCVVR